MGRENSDGKVSALRQVFESLAVRKETASVREPETTVTGAVKAQTKVLEQNEREARDTKREDRNSLDKGEYNRLSRTVFEQIHRLVSSQETGGTSSSTINPKNLKILQSRKQLVEKFATEDRYTEAVELLKSLENDLSDAALPGDVTVPEPVEGAKPLERMLADTGRTRRSDEKNETGRKERAEESAGVVLSKVETATNENKERSRDAELEKIQIALEKVEQEIIGTPASNSKRKNSLEKKKLELENLQQRVEQTPMAHGVSGHGKGTNQEARLLHGRRADETVEHKKKLLKEDGSLADELTQIDLNKERRNQIEIRRVEIAQQLERIQKYEKLDEKIKQLQGPEKKEERLRLEKEKAKLFGDKVGSDPGNTAGAFSSNQAMLSGVNEAFAQADQITRVSENEGLSLDQQRVVGVVKGDSVPVGSTLEVEHTSAQDRNAKLQQDEIEKRGERIKETTAGVRNAKMVMDPAYNEKGQRVGWDMQSLYPTSENETNVDRLASEARHETAVDRASERVRGLREQAATIEGNISAGIKAAKTANDKQKILDNNKSMAAAGREKLEKFVREKRQEAKRGEQAQQELEAAKQQLRVAEDELRQARRARHELSPSEPESPEAANSSPAAPGYNWETGEYKKDRPNKPPRFKGVDIDYEDLTAHHLYPWNQIVKDLNEALKDTSGAKLQKLFRFGRVKAYSGFWDDLKKAPQDRSYTFTSFINHAAEKICWSDNNLFMGPSGSKRSDDPGEKVDETFTKEGERTPGTVLALLADKKNGVIHIDFDDLDNELKAINDASLTPGEISSFKKFAGGQLAPLADDEDIFWAGDEHGELKEYDEHDWEANEEGKLKQKAKS